MFQDREKISGHQALMLILAGGIGNIFVVMSIPAVKEAGRNGWLSVLLGYGIAAVLGLILVKLGLRFPRKTIVQYLPKVLGTVPGKFLGLFYILGWWGMTGIIYRENAELVRFFLPQTPVILISVFMALLVVYAMRQGFEVFARTAELLVPVMIIFIIFGLVAVIQEIDFKTLLPVLENGLGPVIKGLQYQLPYAMETVLFMALWLPCLSSQKNAARAVALGVPAAGLLLTVMVAMTIAFLGTELASHLVYPIYYMLRYALVGYFLTGLEAVFIILWLTSSYLEILVFFYPGVIGLAQWLNLKDYKPLIMPMAAVTVALSMVPHNVVEMLALDSLKNPTILLPLSMLIPVTWFVAVLRKIRED